MTPPTRALLVSHSASLFGAERCLLELALGLATRHDFRVQVVTPGPGELVDALTAAGITVVELPQVFWAFTERPSAEAEPPERARRLRDAIRYLRSTYPDVVLTNTVTVAGMAMSAKLLRIPHIWLIHEFLVREREDPLYFIIPRRAVVRLVGLLSRRVIVPSHALATDLTGRVSSKKLRVVPPAVELTAPPRPRDVTPPSTIRRIVVIGYVARVKRQSDAVLALRLLLDRGMNLELDLIGPADNDYASELADQAAKLGVATRVHQVEYMGDVWSDISDDTIVVSCGANETFGRVAVEAMRRSVPVVAAAANGSAELIRDGDTGLLFSPGNAEELAARVAMLCTDNALRTAITRRAFEWSAGRFSTARYADQVASIIQSETATSAA